MGQISVASRRKIRVGILARWVLGAALVPVSLAGSPVGSAHLEQAAGQVSHRLDRASGHALVTTGGTKRVRLSLKLPHSVYPRGSIVRGWLTVTNLGRRRLSVPSSGIYFTPSLKSVLVDGRTRPTPPFWSVCRTAPCPGVITSTRNSLKRGETRTVAIIGYVVSSRMRLEMGVPGWPHLPIGPIRLTRGAPTQARLIFNSRGHGHISVTRPAGARGALHGAESYSCSGKGWTSLGSGQWRRFAGHTVHVGRLKTCRSARLRAYLGWIGYPAAYVSYSKRPTS